MIELLQNDKSFIHAFIMQIQIYVSHVLELYLKSRGNLTKVL